MYDQDACFMKRGLFTLLLVGILFLPMDLSATTTPDNDLPDGLYAEFITSKGTILVSLEFEKVPMTVANFVGLAEGKIKNSANPEGSPYFNGLVFHRVVEDFMIQGGDPQGNGSGGPGYNFPDEFYPGLTHHSAGTLSMANAGSYTNGSQFFITHKPTPWLDYQHSVFGYVLIGQEVVDAISQGDTINQIKIIRKGEKAMDFDALNIFTQEKSKWELQKEEIEKAQFQRLITGLYPDAKIHESGLMYIIHKEGEGQQATPGMNVEVHYDGKLMNGRKFDSSYDRNQPLQFRLGVGNVIKGWDIGIALLKVGGKAKLFVPHKLGYGEQGYPNVIPGRATLMFDVEVVSVKP